MTKFKIERIVRSKTNKEGKPYITKDGRPYERVAIQVSEMEGTWLSGFGNSQNQDWKEGDFVEIEITTNEKDGKTYYNFRMPSDLEQVKNRLTILEKAVFGNKDKALEKANEALDEEIDPNNLPF